MCRRNVSYISYRIVDGLTVVSIIAVLNLYVTREKFRVICFLYEYRLIILHPICSRLRHVKKISCDEFLIASDRLDSRNQTYLINVWRCSIPLHNDFMAIKWKSCHIQWLVLLDCAGDTILIILVSFRLLHRRMEKREASLRSRHNYPSNRFPSGWNVSRNLHYSQIPSMMSCAFNDHCNAQNSAREGKRERERERERRENTRKLYIKLQLRKRCVNIIRLQVKSVFVNVC